jgi:hypothetical protein
MNYSKLYDPDKANQYVWPMTPKVYKPGQSTSYQLTSEPSPKNWELQGFVMAGPCQVGMYDDEGFYCTYQPSVEGVRPGKYYRVLHGEQINEAKTIYERDRTYAKYGTSYAAAI